MANTCFTNYAVVGPQDQLHKLSNVLWQAWSGNRYETRLDSVVIILGGDSNKYHLRGNLTEIEDDKTEILRFNTETAWSECSDFRHFLEGKFPDLSFYFISEEFGCEYWVTNDDDHTYFKEQYYLSIEDQDSEYCDTIEEVVKLATEMLRNIDPDFPGFDSSTFESLCEFGEKWSEETGLSFTLYSVESVTD